RRHRPRQGQEHRRVEGRRPAVPPLLAVAGGGGERRRVTHEGHPRDRAGAARAARLRDPRGREAHRLRAAGRRDRPVAAVRVRSRRAPHQRRALRWRRHLRPVGGAVTLRIGSLFAGYGGLDQGVSSVLGGEPVWFSEFDAHPSRILAHNYPEVPNLGDITRIDWRTVEPIDVLTGGFPCQDVSHAGARAGLKKGTRTGLWSYMRDAVDVLRPRLVVAENVRGLLSADADSSVEPCPWCVGDPDTSRPMRALGAVLADLADLGYDAWWCGLRAADVGAPHGRFRVFIFAWPADAVGDAWRLLDGDGGAAGRTAPARVAGSGAAVTLFPTPRASDGEKGGAGQRGSSGDLMLPSAVALLPTPAVNDMGEGKTVEWWDEWAPRQQSSDGRPAPHG